MYCPAVCEPVSCCMSSRRFVKTTRCPLVFIVSDSLSGDSSSRLLFPREIQDELDISNIRYEVMNTADCGRDVSPLRNPTLEPKDTC